MATEKTVSGAGESSPAPDGCAPGRDHRLDVEIVDGELRIRIGVQTLAWAAENEPPPGLWGDDARVSVLHPDEWAEDVLRELLREQEDGTTEVHILLDSAMRQAAENGSAAVSVDDGAVDKDDDTVQNYLRSMRFLYSVDDMRITGGREIYQGGVSVQCLERDVQIVKEVQIRLGMTGVTQSALVVLSLMWALSTDNDNQVVSVPIQNMCHRAVTQFRERVVVWEDELRRCR